jgi:hypothetical protein
MPRKSKTQPITTTAPGQPYGVASEQQAAMKTIPLPNSAIVANPVMPSSQNVASPPMPMPQDTPQSSINAVGLPTNTAPLSPESTLTAALNTTPPMGAAFSDPSTYPKNENSMMPVASPTPKSPIANILNMVAEANGNDPALIAIAANAARKGY